MANPARIVVTAALVALVGPIVAAQAPRPATAPRQQTVRGRIVNADNQPVPSARVAISGSPVTVRTDADGRFTIGVPSGSSLVVTKAGFVRSDNRLPAATVGAAEPMTIRLTRAAAISGRVVDDAGDPIVGAFVVAATADKVNEPIRANARVTTDDRGEYRLGGLAPDAYVLSVRTSSNEMQVTEMGGGTRAVGPTPFTTYYPDTLDRSMATPVQLAAGDDRHDLDFHLPSGHASMQEYSLPLPMSPFRDFNVPHGGGAVIRGTVRSTDNRLVPHAQVVLYGGDVQFRSGSTDEKGAYEFSELPAGTYHVAAAKPGFSLPSDGVSLFVLATPPGVPVTVAANDARERVEVTLVPWGAMSGHVLDEAGEPVAGARVGLQLTRYERGRRRLVVARPPQRVTDDRGEFRIYGIPPGQYVVGASVSDAPDAYIGGYAPTYFPGTAAASEARLVSIDAGGDLKGLDFSLVTAATAKVSGTLLDASGQPTTGGRFTLVARSASSTRLDATIGADGNFTFENVPPGRYVIQADRGRRAGFTEGEFGAFPVIVGQFDVTGLQLQTSRGSTITGRFVFDSASGAAAPAPTAITVSPVPVDFDLAPPAIAESSGNAEAVFHVEGITGLRRLQVTKAPPGWALKSVLVNGRDVTDQILEFGRPGESLDDVEVVLTDRINQVAGSVSDDRARPVGGARVVLFSTDRDRWYPASRFIRSAVTAADGSYSIPGPPTGSYFVAAVLRTPPGDSAWEDPQFLELLRSAATVVSMGEGQAQAVNLRVPSR